MYYKKETKSSPFVQISIEECKFIIKGVSYSNDSDVFFKSIIEWIDKEFPKLDCELNCEFYLTVLNSISYKYILHMMIQILRFIEEGKKIKVIWYYDADDEDTFESAQDISKLFNIPFELKESSE